MNQICSNDGENIGNISILDEKLYKKTEFRGKLEHLESGFDMKKSERCASDNLIGQQQI